MTAAGPTLRIGTGPQCDGLVLEVPRRRAREGVLTNQARDALLREATLDWYPSAIVGGVATEDKREKVAEKEGETRLVLMKEVIQHPRNSALRSWLVSALEEMDSDNRVLHLAIEDPDLEPVPWELLGQLPRQSWPPGRIRIARLGHSTPHRPKAARGLQVVVWKAGADELCDQAAEALVEQLEKTEGIRVELLEDPLEPLPVTDDEALVLHVVAHGGSTRSGVVLGACGPGGIGPDDLAFLEKWPRQIDLMVLDVCHSSNLVHDPDLVLASRFVREGVRAVLAPRDRWSATCARQFVERFYPALADGTPLADAVDRGRASLVKPPVGLARVERPWNIVLQVGRTDVATRPLLLRARLPGSEPGDPSLRPVVAEGLRLARRDGYLGVEQLLVALLGERSLLNPTRDTDRVLEMMQHQLGKDLGARPERFRLTPRLQMLLSRLSRGFRPAELAGMLFDTRLLHWLCWVADVPDWLLTQIEAELASRFVRARPGARSVGPSAIRQPAPAVAPPPRPGWPIPGPPPADRVPGELVLEVLGGPEDGRILRLLPGQRLGRRPVPGEVVSDDERPDVVLFAEDPVVDVISVRLLDHLGGGRVLLPPSRRPQEEVEALVYRAVRTGDVRGHYRGEELELSSGDVLKLQRTVFLLVVAS